MNTGLSGDGVSVIVCASIIITEATLERVCSGWGLALLPQPSWYTPRPRWMNGMPNECAARSTGMVDFPAGTMRCMGLMTFSSMLA